MTKVYRKFIPRNMQINMMINFVFANAFRLIKYDLKHTEQLKNYYTIKLFYRDLKTEQNGIIGRK